MELELFTDEEVETAMCLWEAYLADRDEYPGVLTNGGGACGARDFVRGLAKRCLGDYNRMHPDHPMRNEPFDWDYVPRWLKAWYGEDVERYAVTGFDKWGGETVEYDAYDLDEAHRLGSSMCDDAFTKTYQIFDRETNEVVGEG